VTRILRWASLAIVAIVAALVVWVLAARFGRTEELEWLEGTMLDHVERFTLGKPLYVAPSIEWTPILYPPGYFWLCAELTKIMPDGIACRLVSVCSTAATSVLIFFVSRSIGASRFFSALAALLYLACFTYVLEWFDAERVDPLFVALAMSSAFVFLSSPRLSVVAGAILGVAFLVKQQAIIFLAVVPIFLLAFRMRKQAAEFAGAGAAIAISAYFWLQSWSHGWFAYYVFHIPGAHGMVLGRVPDFLVFDVGRGFALTVGMLALFASVGRAIAKKSPPEPAHVFGSFLAAAFVSTAVTRLHVGSWANNLIHWAAFACPAFAYVATQLRERAQLVSLVVAALQAIYFAPSPRRSIPTEASKRAAAVIAERAKALENEGETIFLTRGHLTQKRHAHYLALNDVLYAGDPFPTDFRDGLTDRRYAAIVVDEIERIDIAQPVGTRPDIFDLIAKNYFVAERLPESPAPVVGHASVPRWVLRPRAAPLALDHDALVSRLNAEARELH